MEVHGKHSGRTESLSSSANFRAAGRPTVNFRQISVLPGDFPSTSVNSPCGFKTFCELSVLPGDFLSTSVNYPCDRESFVQFPLNFCAVGRSSVNFREHSVPPVDLTTTSVNFQCYRATFHQLRSTYHAAQRPSVNFPCGRRPSVNFHQLFVWPEYFPSIFRVSNKSSVNFRQLSLPPRDLPSTTVHILCGQDTLRQFPSTLGAVWRPFINCRQFSVRQGHLP